MAAQQLTCRVLIQKRLQNFCCIEITDRKDVLQSKLKEN
jgi:hypothetical protein